MVGFESSPRRSNRARPRSTTPPRQGQSPPSPTFPAAQKAVRFHDDTLSGAHHRKFCTVEDIWAEEQAVLMEDQATAAAGGDRFFRESLDDGEGGLVRRKSEPGLGATERRPLLPRTKLFLRRHPDGGFYDEVLDEKTVRFARDDVVETGSARMETGDAAANGHDLERGDPLPDYSEQNGNATHEINEGPVPPVSLDSDDPADSETQDFGPSLSRRESSTSLGSTAHDAVYIDILDGLHEIPGPKGNSSIRRIDSIVDLPVNSAKIPSAATENASFEDLVVQIHNLQMEAPPDTLPSTASTVHSRENGDCPNPHLFADGTNSRSRGTSPPSRARKVVSHTHAPPQRETSPHHRRGFSFDFKEFLGAVNPTPRNLQDTWAPKTPINDFLLQSDSSRDSPAPPSPRPTPNSGASRVIPRDEVRSPSPGSSGCRPPRPPPVSPTAPTQPSSARREDPLSPVLSTMVPHKSGVYSPGTPTSAQSRSSTEAMVSQRRTHHYRDGSMLEGLSNNVRQAMRSLDDNSSAAAVKKSDQDQILNAFEWDWKRPADEDLIVPPQSWIYLALIGFFSFGVIFFVQVTSVWLDSSVFQFATVLSGFGPHGEFLIVLLCRAAFVAVSYIVIRILSPRFAGGSGIPEMKCVFNGVYLPQALSVTTLVAKVVGMIFSFAAGLSIGKLGPYVHVSCMCAALVSRIKAFTCLYRSARHQMQALSAATAAGVGVALGAPIGGTLLSVELMSTYYYVHWLPMAMYCSIAGYILAVSIMDLDEIPFISTAAVAQMHQKFFAQVVLFVILGAICGKLGDLLVRLSTAVFRLRYRNFRSTARGLLLVVVFTCLHNLIAYSLGGILWESQKDGLTRLFEPKDQFTEKWVSLPVELGRMNAVISLFIFSIAKFFLTGFSIVMPIPAGVFTCVFELGAAIGRCFGELVDTLRQEDLVDPCLFAIVGAAAVTIGVVQAISVAVVMVELTGTRNVNLLPLALGCLTAYIVSKGSNVDFFSAMIKLRRLPFILGLRETQSEERRWWRQNAAGIPVYDFMNKNFPFVTPSTTNREALELLSRGKWQCCAFLNDTDHKLLGTVQRRALSRACSLAIRSATSTQNYSTITTQRAAMDPISFLQEYDPVMGHPAVDPAPFQTPEGTPFWKVATYFQMLGISTIYVTRGGVLVGQLSKAQFIEYNNSLNRKQELRSAAAREGVDVASLRHSTVPTVL